MSGPANSVFFPPLKDWSLSAVVAGDVNCQWFVVRLVQFEIPHTITVCLECAGLSITGNACSGFGVE